MERIEEIQYQVLKNRVPVIICDTYEEAENEAIKHDADEIREIETNCLSI